jgi:hypothetical protein
MDVPAIAKVAFTSEDRVRDVIRNFNADGFDSLYPRYKGGHPPKFTLGQRREIKKIAKSKPRNERDVVRRVETPLRHRARSTWAREIERDGLRRRPACAPPRSSTGRFIPLQSLCFGPARRRTISVSAWYAAVRVSGLCRRVSVTSAIPMPRRAFSGVDR